MSFFEEAGSDYKYFHRVLIILGCSHVMSARRERGLGGQKITIADERRGADMICKQPPIVFGELLTRLGSFGSFPIVVNEIY